jgi:hypothetical protein
MDIGSAFTYVTKDEAWIKKLLIAAVLVLTGIGIIPLMGWVIEIVGRVTREEQEVLPDWSDFGGLIVSGLKLFVAAFVWLLPIILLSACFALIGVAIGSQGSDTVSAIPGYLSILTSCVSVPYGILFSILLPAQIGYFAQTGSLGGAINPANAFKVLRANFGGFLLAWLIAGLALGVLAVIGTIVCVIGIFPAVAYAYAIMGHLYGQAYRQAIQRGALATT